MKRSPLVGALGAMLSIFITLPAHAALIGVLPATSGGTDWQAYYDDQLDITWTANANINGSGTWDNQVAWAGGLGIDGVTGWRLPSMDVNGDNTIVICTADQAACKDNEYGHLFNYGAGTVFGSGITASSPGPFSNVQSNYWSGTEFAPNPSNAWNFSFSNGSQNADGKSAGNFAWAVHSGNVGDGLPPPVIDESATVADDAVIGDGSTVGAGAVIERGVVIGEGSTIGPNVTIKKDVTLGDNAVIGEGSTIGKNVMAGDDLTVGTNVTIHKDVVIGSNVTIGDNSQIHSGTVIGNNVVIGIGVFIGNSVTILGGQVIGNGEVISNNTTVP